MNTVLSIISSLLGIFAAWYIAKKALPWVQAYRNSQQEKDLEAARKKAQEENQQANSDSDALAQREREHDGG